MARIQVQVSVCACVRASVTIRECLFPSSALDASEGAPLARERGPVRASADGTGEPSIPAGSTEHGMVVLELLSSALDNTRRGRGTGQAWTDACDPGRARSCDIE